MFPPASVRTVLPAPAITLFLAALVLAAPAGAAMTSRYTDLDLGACKERLVQEEGQSYEFDCPGLDGVGVFAAEGDLRQDIDFGVRNGSFDTFGGFNNLGPRIEWRLDDKDRPVAAIVRFMIDGSDEAGKPVKAQVLAISTIGTASRPGCPVAYVDALANEDANAMARRVADEKAAEFRCGSDRASYVGKVSPAAGGATAVSE